MSSSDPLGGLKKFPSMSDRKLSGFGEKLVGGLNLDDDKEDKMSAKGAFMMALK